MLLVAFIRNRWINLKVDGDTVLSIHVFTAIFRRAAARTRTQHLGISSIDVEEVHEDLSNRPASFDNVKEPQFEAETQKRASLILPRRDTVLSLLRRPEHSAVFKLHTLADNFFGALQDVLDNNEHFLGTVVADGDGEADDIAERQIDVRLRVLIGQGAVGAGDDVGRQEADFAVEGGGDGLTGALIR